MDEKMERAHGVLTQRRTREEKKDDGARGACTAPNQWKAKREMGVGVGFGMF